MNPRATMGDKPSAHALDRLAADVGLVTTYRNGFGRMVTAPVDSVRAVLSALGLESLQHPERARRALWAQRASQGIDPVLVAWNGRLLTIQGTFAASTRVDTLRFRVLLEQGGTLTGSARLLRSEKCGASRDTQRCTFQTDLQLALGYHQLELEGASELRAIIAAPERLAPVQGKQFGLFAPVHSLRGSSGQGVGTLTELRALSRWAKAEGAAFIGVLPLLATFLDHPYDPSPFAPASKLFWNDALLDVRELPELSEARVAREMLGAPESVAQLAALEASDHVRFRERMRFVERMLSPLSQAWLAAGGLESRELAALRDTAPDLDHYAVFRALTEVHGPASGWSEAVREHARAGTRAPPERVARHQYRPAVGDHRRAFDDGGEQTDGENLRVV